MGTIIAGDLHLKQSRVLPLIDAALERTGARRVVFCGDYTDDWGSTDADELQELAIMGAWAGERRRGGVQVDLLMGNHDFAYFTGRGNAGTHTWITPEVRRLLTEAGIAMATSVDDILVTHAGLTRSWAQRSLGARTEGHTDPVCAGKDRDELAGTSAGAGTGAGASGGEQAQASEGEGASESENGREGEGACADRKSVV